MRNSSVKETAVLMAKLGIICIIVSGLLALVNSITQPVIQKNEYTNFIKSMSEVLPQGGDFKQVSIDSASEENGVALDSLYSAENGGYVATAICKEGYGGDISVMVGINEDMTVNRIKIMAISETAGLGAKAGTDAFTSQYQGLKSDIGYEKNNGGSKDNNTISAISGATVTTKAVTKAVNFALQSAERAGEQYE